MLTGGQAVSLALTYHGPTALHHFPSCAINLYGFASPTTGATGSLTYLVVPEFPGIPQPVRSSSSSVPGGDEILQQLLVKTLRIVHVPNCFDCKSYILWLSMPGRCITANA